MITTTVQVQQADGENYKEFSDRVCGLFAIQIKNELLPLLQQGYKLPVEAKFFVGDEKVPTQFSFQVRHPNDVRSNTPTPMTWDQILVADFSVNFVMYQDVLIRMRAGAAVRLELGVAEGHQDPPVYS